MSLRARVVVVVVAAVGACVAAPACDLLSSAECSVDTDCHGSHVCVANQCVECRTDRDCDVAETCSAGTCERGGHEGEGVAGEGEGATGGEGEGSVGGEGEGATGGEGEGSFGGEGEGSSGGEGEGSAALSLSLTWDNENSDVDIHATKGTPFCLDAGATAAQTTTTFGPLSQACTPAPADCNFLSCAAVAATSVDWDGDGVPGESGDPKLETDWISVQSSCPNGTPCSPLELIDVAAPVSGTYLVEAVYYADPDTTTSQVANVTLTVAFHGSTVKTVHAALAAPQATKDLAIVHVNSSGNVTCVGDVTDGVDECP